MYVAYEVLSDADKRRQYDMGGHSGRQGFPNGSGQHGGHKFHTRARDFDFDFNDLFKHFHDDIFGGHAGSHEGHAGGGHFESHFGSHFARHAHSTGFEFEDLFGEESDFFGHFEGSFFGQQASHSRQAHSATRRSASGQQRCETVTQKVGNMVTSYTRCS